MQMSKTGRRFLRAFGFSATIIGVRGEEFIVKFKGLEMTGTEFISRAFRYATI